MCVVLTLHVDYGMYVNMSHSENLSESSLCVCFFFLPLLLHLYVILVKGEDAQKTKKNIVTFM